MSKANGLDASEWARAPPSGPLWQRTLKAIYNPEDGSFLGRTAKRWGIVVLFYMIFYAVLGVMFSLCMGGLFLSLDRNRPTYTLGKSLIGMNPGVAYRPLPVDNTLEVKLDLANSSTHECYESQLLDFFAPYSDWMAQQTACVANDSFGYPDTPCFFIKLNKIFDWTPEFYEANSLPADMPSDLVQHIQSSTNPKQVWISCAEERRNSTKIEYPWGRGLPDSFYPYLNKEGYLSPVVAVRLLPPANTLTTIRCRAWAKNIIHNKSLKEPSGYTRIQLSIAGDASVNTTEAAE